MHRSATLLSLIAATFISTVGTAEDTAKASTAIGVVTFEALDRNADAQISRTEAGMDKQLLDRFASIDTDGDGYVSKAEYAAHKKS